MAQIYVYSDKIYFLCKVGELCKLIRQFSGEYKTVKELLAAKNHLPN